MTRTLRQVGDDVEVPALIGPEPPKPAAKPHPAADVLFLALKALSQRALLALAALRNLALAATVFWLWISIIGAPTVLQLVGGGMYAMFALAVMWIWRGDN